MTEEEKRRFRRYETEGLHGSLVFSLDADVKNISVAGMAVATSIPVAVDQQYRVGLQSELETISLLATAKWCHLARTERSGEDEQRPVYEAGFSFEGVLADSAQNLVGFLTRNVVIDVDERVFGRFDPKDEQSATLAADCAFEVRKLSLSGMLIELAASAAEDTRIELDLDLEGEPFHARGRIVNVTNAKAAEKRLHYLMGVEFLELDDESLALLRSYIYHRLEEPGEEPGEEPSAE